MCSFTGECLADTHINHILWGKTEYEAYHHEFNMLKLSQLEVRFMNPTPSGFLLMHHHQQHLSNLGIKYLDISCPRFSSFTSSTLEVTFFPGSFPRQWYRSCSCVRWHSFFRLFASATFMFFFLNCLAITICLYNFSTLRKTPLSLRLFIDTLTLDSSPGHFHRGSKCIEEFLCARNLGLRAFWTLRAMHYT